jgi:hypothetical protein
MRKGSKSPFAPCLIGARLSKRQKNFLAIKLKSDIKQIMTILPPIHTSPETAFVVNSYPYGFRLRCKIRYWLETNNKGTRFMSQTTNPKKGDIWNKPKASTYADLSGAMYLDENGHVQWSSFSSHNIDKGAEWLAKFEAGATNLQAVKSIVRLREIFDEELNKFSPRPEYGTALFKSAYMAASFRHKKEENEKNLLTN